MDVANGDMTKGTASKLRYTFATMALFVSVECVASSHGLPSSTIQDCIAEAASATAMPADLIYGVAKVESAFDPHAVSSAEAIGVMQIRWPLTALHLGITRRSDLFDPCININAGSRYLAELHLRFPEAEDAIAAYYIGPTRLHELRKSAYELPGYVHTYVRAVRTARLGFSSSQRRRSRSKESLVVFSSRYQYRALRLQEAVTRKGVRGTQLVSKGRRHEIQIEPAELNGNSVRILLDLLGWAPSPDNP